MRTMILSRKRHRLCEPVLLVATFVNYRDLPPLLFALCLVFSGMARAQPPRTLLFVDDYEILYRPATRRVLHHPQRHPANPLLTGPTIKHQVAYNSVYRDPATGRYQMWYQ